VPFIASWPGVTPAGKVLDDIVSFADPYATFAEIAGVKPPETLKSDSHSIAPQLRGEPGTQRPYAYVQLGERWFVREPGFKLTQTGDLFDMSDAPFTEKPIAPEADTEQSKAARQRLAAVLAELNPSGGKTDKDAPNRPNRPGLASTANPVGPWKSGDVLAGPQAPKVAGKAIEVSAEVDQAGTSGVIVSQGGAAQGYAVYLKDGKLAFAVRENKELTTIVAKEPLGNGHVTVQATIHDDGALALLVDGKSVAEGKASGPIPSQPKAGLFVGKSGNGAVGEYETPDAFSGKISNVNVKATEGK
jgi:hypothetical protein